MGRRKKRNYVAFANVEGSEAAASAFSDVAVSADAFSDVAVSADDVPTSSPSVPLRPPPRLF